MRINSILVGIFVLLLALQINCSKAAKTTRNHLNNMRGISLSKRPQPQSQAQLILSQHDKKLIDDASLLAFEKLKRFYVINSRSRFG